MLFTFQLNEFTEDEIDFILYVLNVIYPTGIEVDYRTLQSVKANKLAEKISGCGSKVTEAGKPIWESICSKMGIKV